MVTFSVSYSYCEVSATYHDICEYPLLDIKYTATANGETRDFRSCKDACIFAKCDARYVQNELKKQYLAYIKKRTAPPQKPRKKTLFAIFPQEGGGVLVERITCEYIKNAWICTESGAPYTLHKTPKKQEYFMLNI